METYDFKNNPEYKEIFKSEVHSLSLFMPCDIANGYHISRYVAANAQDIFSSSGATKAFQQKVFKQIKDWCNTEKSIVHLKTNIGTLIDNLLYRHEYPVDELCSIRMGAIFCFMEGENPSDTKDFWTQKKVDLATGDYEKEMVPDPDLYTFFLTMGIQYTASYDKSLITSIDSDYFLNRREMLKSLIPEALQPSQKK